MCLEYLSLLIDVHIFLLICTHEKTRERMKNEQNIAMIIQTEIEIVTPGLSPVFFISSLLVLENEMAQPSTSEKYT